MKETVTEVVKAEDRDHPDYTIRMLDNHFALRPYAQMPPRSKAAKVFEKIGWAAPRQPVHVSVPANVGDVAQVQAFGDRAWLRVGDQQYACGIVRQTLFSAPLDGPNAAPAQKTETAPASKPDNDQSTPRPTLRREQ